MPTDSNRCRFCATHPTVRGNVFCEPSTGRKCGRLWLGISLNAEETMLINMRRDPAGLGQFSDVFGSFFR